MADEIIEMTALASVCAVAGIVAMCEELRRLGLLDEAGTSRVETAMRTSSRISDAPFVRRREFGALLDMFFSTMRERAPVNLRQ